MQLQFTTIILAITAAPVAAMATRRKTITFVRHGCTYMNEYLGRNPAFAPNFHDVFTERDNNLYYRDSPLSELGQNQAKALDPSFLSHAELIVTSPLTRALQTLQLGIIPHLKQNIPILALPEAAERLYLISDVGRHVRHLSNFKSVCFETEMASRQDAWWYQAATNYVEWRPKGQGQRYACPGEPLEAFSARMRKLYQWLDDRPESSIAVVCHHGVIDWMTDMDFNNCQWREYAWEELKPVHLSTALENKQINGNSNV
jgi:broad specificity phosphatase PhoE